MSPGNVNGWWVVAGAAAPILIDLLTTKDAGAFVAFCVIFSIFVVPCWYAIRKEL